MVSLSVIGTHGLLSGTATMDFGGKKGAATAVGVIDGFVYLGVGLQSLALGKITSRPGGWADWPHFLAPFAVVGAVLLLTIWRAMPTRRGRKGH
jgi:OPA family glycerol-3-phosphate transporter-like MFS transporter